jgi:hypothetical protein
MTPKNRRLLAQIKAKLNPPPRSKVGNWVRTRAGALIWDPWDMDAPPDHDPMPGILDALERTAKNLREGRDWKEPTEEQKAETRRVLEERRERQRAERQAVRDFTAFVERELAAGKSLSEIGAMPAAASTVW